MALDLLLFTLLAAALNTGLPVAFDPVLVAWTADRAPADAALFAVAASLGTGLSGVADMAAARLLAGRRLPEWTRSFPAPSGRRFYAWTALMAFSPLPFTIVRATLLRERPRAAGYALAIAAGRLPRYLLTVLFWGSLALPAWASAAILTTTGLLFVAAPRARRVGAALASML
jgi:hypothetical protein